MSCVTPGESDRLRVPSSQHACVRALQQARLLDSHRDRLLKCQCLSLSAFCSLNCGLTQFELLGENSLGQSSTPRGYAGGDMLASIWYAKKMGRRLMRSFRRSRRLQLQFLVGRRYQIWEAALRNACPRTHSAPCVLALSSACKSPARTSRRANMTP